MARTRFEHGFYTVLSRFDRVILITCRHYFRVKYHIKPRKLVQSHQSSTSLSIEHNEKQTPNPRHSKSETSVSQTETCENQNTTTITSEDVAEADNEASDTVRGMHES